MQCTPNQLRIPSCCLRHLSGDYTLSSSLCRNLFLSQCGECMSCFSFIISYMYIMKCDHICPNLPLPILSIPPTTCHSFQLHLFFYNSVSPVCAIHMCLMWGNTLKQRNPISGHILKKLILFLLSQRNTLTASTSTAHMSMIGGRSGDGVPHLCWILSGFILHL